MDRREINPWSYQEKYGISHAVELTGVKRLVFCTGQTSVDGNGEPVHAGDMAAQITQALDNLEYVLKEAGLQFSDIVRLNCYTTDVEKFSQVSDLVKNRISINGRSPASALLEVSSLFHPDVMVEFEATAAV